LRQKVASGRHIFKRVDDDDTVASDHKSGIAAGSAAVGANRGIDTFTDFFDREIRSVRRISGKSREGYQECGNYRPGSHAGDVTMLAALDHRGKSRAKKSRACPGIHRGQARTRAG